MKNILNKVYIIEKQTSKSKFGTTYKCRHAESGEKLIVKNLFAEPDTDYIRTLNKLNEIDEPHLPQHKYIQTSNGEHLIVRRYYEGSDLKSILKNPFKYSRLSKNFIVEVFIEVFKALHILHQNQILHTDIKPANIIIKHTKWFSPRNINPNDIAIIDIEQALPLPVLHNKGFALIYSPPEQILKYNHLFCPATDIFAACVTMLETLTNKKPLYDCNAEVMINLQLTYPIPKPVKIDNALFSILQKGFYKDRFPRPPRQLTHGQVNEILTRGLKKRCNNARQMADDLLSWLKTQN